MNKLQKLFTPKNLIYFLGLVIVSIYILSSSISKQPPKTTTDQQSPLPTPTNQLVNPTDSSSKQEPYNTDPEYNRLFDQGLKDYQKENDTQDFALRRIRSTLPIIQDKFTIKSYDYSNNTYTVEIKKPYDTTKKAVLLWFYQQGVTKPENFRLNYLEN